MNDAKKISIIIPAHNEERYINGCLAAIVAASNNVHQTVEIIVVLNRCNDATEQIAKRYDAFTVVDGSRCIAAVRNRGIAEATGDILVTCDADSRLHPQSLALVVEALSKQDIIGGGMPIRYDRRSLGIRMSELCLDFAVKLTGLSAGAFWAAADTFRSVSGFDENLLIVEDVDLARRIKAYGKSQKKRYICLNKAPLLTSARKFDHFGDWSFFRMATLDAPRIWRSLKRIDTDFADEYFHDFNDQNKTDDRNNR
ncbi:glycosyltransferase [Cellvibrio mixtus]|uniref:glycosyltransferase n=1 Tax=Cellvibrio mixtus TaxID=39650 RepID=UPI000587A0BA|nr:glycosyltransferase [Cellvibrio mixtus]